MSRTGIQLAIKFEEKRLLEWLEDVKFVFCQPKFNGVRAWFDGDHLISSEGHIVTSVPHVVSALRDIEDSDGFDGELYRHGWALQQIRAVTGRTVNQHPDYGEIQFVVFDRKMPGMQVARIGQLERTPVFLPVRRAPYIQAYSVQTCEEYFHKAINNGYEGIVIRHPRAEYVEKRSTFMMKWKARLEDTFEIIEAVEGQGKYSGSLGALVVRNRSGDTFHVGSFKVNDQERLQLWEQREFLPGRYARVRFFELSMSGRPPSGVFVRLLEHR